MLGFGRKGGKEPPAPAAGARGPPTQKILSMSSQGFSEPEIVKTLREEGYSPIEVDRGMKDAMRSGSAGSAQGAPPAPMPPPAEPVMPASPGQMQPPAPPGPEGPPGPMPPEPAGGFELPAQASKDRFAPTKWENDDDMMDDTDIDKIPKDRRMGPDAFMDRVDDMGGQSMPPPPEREPLPFARPPLPKDKDDREVELKDRRRREVEELTEEVAEEKMRSFTARMDGIEERIEKLESGIKNVSAQAPGGSPDELNAVRKDIDAQKQSTEEVNARIDSIEEVVKGSLVPMIESVRKIKHATAAPAEHQEKPDSKSELPEPPVVKEPSEPPRYAPKK